MQTPPMRGPKEGGITSEWRNVVKKDNRKFNTNTLSPFQKNSINIGESHQCKNRECTKPAGYPERPGSIYCSSKCQSRGIFITCILIRIMN